jgi:hypothetical protein
MKRKGHINNSTEENFENAFWRFSRYKHHRKGVQAFEENLQENLRVLLRAYLSQTWKTSEYIPKEVFKPKHRIVHKSTVMDHVIQWSSVLPIENWLFDTLYHRAPACVPGKGTHCFVRQERDELRRCNQEEVYYYVQLDVHHYFEDIDHEIMKKRIREKIKDPKLLHFLDEFIESFPNGLVLGVKLSQLLSGLYLAPFDRTALRCFGLLDDPSVFRYWQDRYVTACLLTCRTRQQADELNKGVEYLNRKFENYVKDGLRHYSRFADNIVIKHSDKTFLHIITRIAIETLSEEYRLTVNKSWNVRPVWMGNDICGYVFFHEYVKLRKRNKKALCKQVAKLCKAGFDSEQIRLKTASRVGFAIHADTKNLLKKLKMEKRLGKVVKKRKKKVPFEGMVPEQKKSIEDIVCTDRDIEDAKIIRLLDYKIEDSIINSDEDGSPKQRIAIRYNVATHVEYPAGGEGEPSYTWSKDEFYSFSGSKVMIDQAENDFSKEDLPVATVVKEFVNKQRKKFYKFT